MIAELPLWISALFLGIVTATLFLYYLSNKNSGKLLGIIVIWSAIQSGLAFTGFYENLNTIPPRLIFVLLPSVALIIFGLMPAQRIKALENRNLIRSPFLHVVRIPVEMVLLLLFTHGAVPELMTFEGRNFDIITGITAPIVGLLYWKNVIGNKAMITWNVMGLGLVLFVLTNGVLSAASPFQQFAFDQPNTGVFYFPFILLPAVIVPMVIYVHITDIIKLSKN